MSKQDDGGPAFPTNSTAYAQGFGGMQVRDWLAGQAMAALIAKLPLFDRDGTIAPTPPDRIRDDVAESAYAYADAMLAARTALARAKGTEA